MLKSALTLAILSFAFTSLGSAQVPERLIYSFNGTNGRTADSGLIADARGNVYGTTFNGGPNSLGSVYELSPISTGTWRETVLYNFSGNDGAFPVASLTFDRNGNLYGTTQLGGLGTCSTSGGQDLGCGVVFKLTPSANGWQESTVYEFQPGVNKGVVPVGGVIFDTAGNLYGTTWAPGVEGDGIFDRAGANPLSNTYWGCDEPGCGGTVYKLTPTQNGWQESDIYAFTGAADGSSSMANLTMDSAGNLYGTTPFGGTGNCQYGCGTVFEVSSSNGGWTETVLHSFASTDGAYPMGALTPDAAGNFYSTTNIGGSHHQGTVFELAKSGQQWQESVLYNFTGGADGASPYAGVIFDSRGNIYGTATEGGTNSVGTIYSLVPNNGGWSQIVLHEFQLGNNDGQLPYGAVMLWNNFLLGATQGGGTHNEGAVYEVFP
ncbi:MAG TPA: choice-of-anchor tandem repeat GloVer-containing protein [Verrucomicrobiae bacterium]|jgi:uncharacterized repeat protein (TIGR03803 family)|nr:choice-of-anchor tandem repeat GloVer-containing protein [Verrucomicrobiae bacterium]